MLTQIYIQNFTIIDQLSIDFEDGLSVLTGETGAGKSIWVDAVSYALGARADQGVIRHGESRCEITLCFDLNKLPQAKKWLKENDYDADDECQIRRIIARESSSKTSINGKPCPLQLIRELATRLLNIHSQHENQALLKRPAQQYRLDTYAGNNQLLTQVSECFQRWKSTQEELELLRARANNRDAELNLVRYQLDELNALDLKPDEWQTLSHQHQQMHGAKDLIQQINSAIQLTIENSDVTASQLLEQAIQEIDRIQLEDPQIKSAKELLNTAAIHLQEAGNELSNYREHLDLSPENLTMIEERLSKIHELARKHHTNPEDLREIQQTLSEKLSQLENIDVLQETLEKALIQYEQQYIILADKLSTARKKAANTLNKAITKSIQDLGITGGQFQIDFEQRDTPHPDGQEKIEFQICSNPGQPFQALSKIASGGELSRVSLALQVITAKKDHTPTMIFDEVDTGIGGKTAETVGQLLRELGKTTQVLCITHLAQVAGQGHQHFKIMKSSDKNSTHTSIMKLNKQQRIEELARMLSGSKISKQTLAHAEEMLT